MKKHKTKLILVLICAIFICGCGKSNDIKGEDKVLTGQEAKVEVINNGALLVDVRTEEEYNNEHISGAVSLPLAILEDNAENVIPSKDKIIIVYCNSGVQSKKAQEKLISIGYKTVYNMGAMSGWYE